MPTLASGLVLHCFGS